MKGSPELGGPFVSYGVWLRQMDLIRGPARYGVALVHYGLLSVGSPHSSASQPPSPQGKAFLGGTTLQNCTALPEPSPGGKVPPCAHWGGGGPRSARNRSCTNVPTHPTEAPIQSIWRSQTPFVHILNKFSTFFARSRKSGWTFFARLRTMRLAQQRGRTHDP